VDLKYLPSQRTPTLHDPKLSLATAYSRRTQKLEVSEKECVQMISQEG